MVGHEGGERVALRPIQESLGEGLNREADDEVGHGGRGVKLGQGDVALGKDQFRAKKLGLGFSQSDAVIERWGDWH
jgi:hypothetical protein